jgi:hypothetical protein
MPKPKRVDLDKDAADVKQGIPLTAGGVYRITIAGPTTLSLQLLDDVGQPIEGIEVIFKVGDDELRATTGADGVAKVQAAPPESGEVTVRIADEDALREKLRSVWGTLRDWAVPEGADVLELGAEPDAEQGP